MLSERLDGRVALITGGSRGIGRAIALRLAEAGANIAILYAGNEAAASETCAAIEALGVKAFSAKCDVSNSEDVTAAVKGVHDALGKVDILVNNAGITRDGISLRMKEEDFRRVIDVNLTGAFLVTQAVMSDFIRRRSGHVINIASVAGQMGNAGQANYSSAKAGMIGLTKTLARELAGRGVTVNAVAPGFVRTEMTAAMSEDALRQGVSTVPMGRMAEPEEIAEAVCFLAGDRAAYITGTVLSVNGGLYM